MAFYDWNRNGRQDSFYRYMDYKASHLTSDYVEETDSYDEDYYDDEYDYDDYGEESFEKIKQQLSAQEKVPYYKNHPYEEEKEEKPPYLFVIIISIIVGVLNGIIATLVNR